MYVKPSVSVSTLGQSLWKRLPALDCEDPHILCRSRGKRHHHGDGDDVCGGSCVRGTGTVRTIPTIGIPRDGIFFIPAQTLVVVKLLMYLLSVPQSVPQSVCKVPLHLCSHQRTYEA